MYGGWGTIGEEPRRACLLTVTTTTPRQRHPFLVLAAWATIYGALLSLVLWIDSDAGRAWRQHGWAGIHGLGGLVALNAMAYLSVWRADPGFITPCSTSSSSRDNSGSGTCGHGAAPGDDVEARIRISIHTPRHPHAAALQLRCDSSGCSSSDGGETPLHAKQQAAGVCGGGDEERWCRRCFAMAPLRSKHCSSCGRCVRSFDHHCMWVATCIGAANHGRFVIYLVIHVCVNVVVLHHSLTALRHNAHVPHWGLRQATAVLLTLAFLLTFCMLGGLLMLHLCLVANNITTWELFQQQRVPYMKHLPPCHSPFSKGLLLNLYHFCADRRAFDAPATAAELGCGASSLCRLRCSPTATGAAVIDL